MEPIKFNLILSTTVVGNLPLFNAWFDVSSFPDGHLLSDRRTSNISLSLQRLPGFQPLLVPSVIALIFKKDIGLTYYLFNVFQSQDIRLSCSSSCNLRAILPVPAIEQIY